MFALIRPGAMPISLCLFCLVGLTSCGRPLSDAECGELLDRYTDRQIDQARPSATPGERARLIGQAREKADTDPVFARCSLEVSRGQFDCAMAASDVDAMERCLL